MLLPPALLAPDGHAPLVFWHSTRLYCRAADEEDFGTWADLADQYLGRPYAGRERPQFDAFMESCQSAEFPVAMTSSFALLRLFCRTDDDAVVGYVESRFERCVQFNDAVCIGEQYRRQGYMREIVERSASTMVANGVKEERIRLVREDAQPAATGFTDWLERHGFQLSNERDLRGRPGKLLDTRRTINRWRTALEPK